MDKVVNEVPREERQGGRTDSHSLVRSAENAAWEDEKEGKKDFDSLMFPRRLPRFALIRPPR